MRSVNLLTDRGRGVVQVSIMKMIASRELSVRPGAVFSDFASDGAVIVTRDGTPMGLITPTSPETLIEDM